MPIEDTIRLYRMVHVSARDKANKAIPSISAFTPTPNDNGKLSVDNASITTPETSLGRFGATYRFNSTTFKKIEDFNVYALNCGEIRELNKAIEIFSDPINNNPEVVGKPNNISHSLIDINAVSDEDEPELYLKLRDMAQDVIVDINVAKDHSFQLRRNWGL
jgi:hypothetical protein